MHEAPEGNFYLLLACCADMGAHQLAVCQAGAVGSSSMPDPQIILQCPSSRLAAPTRAACSTRAAGRCTERANLRYGRAAVRPWRHVHQHAQQRMRARGRRVQAVSAHRSARLTLPPPRVSVTRFRHLSVLSCCVDHAFMHQRFQLWRRSGLKAFMWCPLSLRQGSCMLEPRAAYTCWS